MDPLTKLLVNSLLNKGAVLSKASLKRFRVLGIDEVGISDPIGSIFIGFYIETHVRKYTYLKDSKKLSKAEVIKRARNLKGFSLVQTIPPDSINSYKNLKAIMRKKILEGLGQIPADAYDVIVIDGHPGLLNQDLFSKPILSLPHGDEKVYEVAAASLKAKAAMLQERDGILKEYSHMLNVSIERGGMSFAAPIFRLIGPAPIFKLAYIILKFKKRAAAELHLSVTKAKADMRYNILQNVFTKESTWACRHQITERFKRVLDNLKNRYIIANYREPKLYISHGFLFCRVPVQYCVSEKFENKFFNICELKENTDENQERDN